MINLIPPQGRMALKHEYTLRVLSLYGFLLGGVFVAGTALMVPTFVLTNAQVSNAQNESSNVNETRAIFEEAFAEIRVTNTIMAQLRKQKSGKVLSEVIEEIVHAAPQGITFTTFDMARDLSVLKEVRVRGVASNRVALASFKESLEDSPTFSRALVPISDLAKESDLTFAITITLEEDDTVKP